MSAILTTWNDELSAERLTAETAVAAARTELSTAEAALAQIQKETQEVRAQFLAVGTFDQLAVALRGRLHDLDEEVRRSSLRQTNAQNAVTQAVRYRDDLDKATQQIKAAMTADLANEEKR